MAGPAGPCPTTRNDNPRGRASQVEWVSRKADVRSNHRRKRVLRGFLWELMDKIQTQPEEIDIYGVCDEIRDMKKDG